VVFAVPDQKADRLARLFVDELLPLFGVPEADCGANLLAHVMQDMCCALLGIHKLNTTAYHPQCNGMVEQLNRTLKAMLRKHAARSVGPVFSRNVMGVQEHAPWINEREAFIPVVWVRLSFPYWGSSITSRANWVYKHFWLPGGVSTEFVICQRTSSIEHQDISESL